MRVSYKKIVSLFLLSFLLVSLKPSSDNMKFSEIRGTYIIAGICKEGIVISSDSRFVFLSSSKKITAWYDEAPKLFEYKKIIIGMVGRYGFDDTLLFSSIFKRVCDSLENGISVRSFYNIFSKKIRILYGENIYRIFIGNQFFVCGYESGKPLIFIHERNGSDSLLHKGYYSSNTTLNGRSDIAVHLDTIGINKTAYVFETITKDIIKRHNKDTVAIIGGPISLGVIKDGRVGWIYRQQKNEYNTLRELRNAYKKGELKMGFRSYADSIAFEESVKD